MSMEISGNYKDYKNEYLERAQTEQDKVKRTSQEQRAEDKSEGVPIPKDEYISSEKSGSKPSGLYRLGQDENGNPKVMYDDPKRAAKAKDVQPKEEPAKKAEKCTTNTDNVDREIEKLKEEKKQLEQLSTYTVLYDQTQLAIRIKASDKNLAKLDTSQINASIDLNGMGVGDYEVPVKITLPDGYELVDSVKTTIHIKEKAVANKTTGTN